MNLEAQARYAARAAEVKALGGLPQARASALSRLALKTVVKEAHGEPVVAVEFSPDPATSNLFATVGKNQLTIYDDCHFSDYVAVVAQFNSERTAAGAAGGDLAALAWVAPALSKKDRNRPSGPDLALDAGRAPSLDASGSADPSAPTATDALVAVAGASGQVSVVSVARCEVVALLGDAFGNGIGGGELGNNDDVATTSEAATPPPISTAPSRLPAVVALAGAPGVPGLLASLDCRGNVTLWDCLSARPLSKVDVGEDALSVALSPDGKSLATGHRGGGVRTCPIPGELVKRCGRQPGLEGGGGGRSDAGENDGTTEDGDKTPLPPTHPAARPPPPLPAAAVCGRVDALSVEVAEDASLGGGGTTGGEGILPPEFRRRRAPHSSPVDGLRFLSDNRLASKASDGSVVVFDLPTPSTPAAEENSPPATVVSSFRAPGCGLGGGGAASRCSLSSTRDGSYLALGTHTGEAFVYESATGKRAARVGTAPRIKGAAVRGVGVSEDCRHLVVAAGAGGFVCRFEAKPNAAVVAVEANAAGAQDQPSAAA